MKQYHYEDWVAKQKKCPGIYVFVKGKSVLNGCKNKANHENTWALCNSCHRIEKQMVSKKYREEFDIQKPYIVLVRNPETIKADWVNPEGHAYKPDVYMVKAMTKKEMKHRLNNKDGFSIQPQDIVLVVKEAMCVEQTIVSKIVGSFPKTEVKKSRLVKTIVNHF